MLLAVVAGGTGRAQEEVVIRGTVVNGTAGASAPADISVLLLVSGADNSLIATSAECRRDNARFPMVGPAQECLLQAKVRIHDAYGYWPVRSFRASEAVANAQLALYRSMGGKRA